MSKAQKIDKAIGWLTIAGAAYFVGTAIAGAIKRKRETTSGIGKAERVKRRIYKEVSLAQGRGVDFTQKYIDLSGDAKIALVELGQEMGWKQSKRSIESGKSYPEAYYNSLRRAWNAVSGVQGIGAAGQYTVYDADGHVCLNWYDVEEHLRQEHEEFEKSRVLEEKPKAKRATKANKAQADYDERLEFALMVWNDKFLDTMKGYTFNDKIGEKAHPIMRDFKSKHEFAADGYAKGLVRVKRKKGYGDVIEYNLDGKWYLLADGNTQFIVDYIKMVFDDEKQMQEDAGWKNNADKLDDIRRALLDKAKLMQVIINTYPEYEDKTHNVRYYEPQYDREVEKLVHDYGDVVSGEDRYNHLDKINYVIWTSRRDFGHGGVTYYPIRSYPDYEGAEYFVLNKYGKSGAKVLPIWDVPIEKITGLV